jgi:hypothetical protein
MRIIRFLLSAALAVIFTAGAAFPTRADAITPSPPGIPLKALLLVDAGFAVTSTRSGMYDATRKMLNVNKISFDVLDVSQVDKYTFEDADAGLRYSVLLIMAPGWRMDNETNSLILQAARDGMGVVGMLPDAASTDLMPLFGIEELGTDWKTARGITFVQDKFTFSYKDATIDGDFSYLPCRLNREAAVVGKFDGTNDPAVWCYQYGAARTVFHDSPSALTSGYRGILLESILYAMPLGVACPVNAGVIEVDDCPLPLYTDQLAEEAYYNYYANFKKWLATYNFKASFFLVFSYNGNMQDFYLYPESLECANDIIRSGNEIGLHVGTNHTPLKVSEWGSREALDSEVKAMAAAMDELRVKLKARYGTELGEVVSYIPPANEIDDYGFEALARETKIKYVGTVHFGNEEVSARDFGREGNLEIFNLPRSGGGGFHIFNEPQDRDYSNVWNTLRSVIESGDSYLIFTHPYAWEYQDEKRFGNGSMTKLFDSYRTWADYVSRHYPFYRWWTSAELGDYLANRKGALSGRWDAGSNRLTLELSQPDDVIHIKAQRYLKTVEAAGNTVVLTFTNMPEPVYSDRFEITTIGQDYFLCPKSLPVTHAAVPSSPFVFNHVTWVKPPEPAPAPVVTVEFERSNRSPVMALVGFAAAGVVFLVGLVVLRRSRRKE